MDDIGILVGPLIPPLRRYARALLHDRAAADDLVQDCLERAISRWHQRRAEGSTRTWLFTILHNLAVNRMRASARRGPHVEIDETMVVTAPDQEDALRHRDLLRALDALSEDHRSVLLLVSVEDLSYSETAEVLGVPIGTVMSRLARGRERLAAVLEGQPVAREPRLRRVK